MDFLKKHGLSIVLILIAIFVYFSPALKGKVIVQSDIIQSLATSKETRDYREQTGEEPLWTTSQFGGMPTYQMNTEYPNNLLNHFERIKRVFPTNLGLIFIIALGFYIMLYSMKVDYRLALIGSIAFAFSTFFILSLEAGHNSKLRTIGYMAPIIASIVTTFNGKRLLGFALSSLTLALSFNSNHPQISYYTLILILVIGVVYLVNSFKSKTTKNVLISGSVLLLAVFIALGPNVSKFWSSYDYSKETIRGGKSELTSDKKQTTGLDWEYAMSWSLGKMETITFLIPDVYGRSSSASLDKDSETYNQLVKLGVPKSQAKDYIKSLPLYWGEQPFTTGPYYIGAIFCFLFILGCFVVKGPLKWWLISGTVVSIMLAWGKHFFINEFVFDYLPMYNKFRNPAMILTIACLTIPTLGIIGVNEILKSGNKINFKKPLLYAGIITGGICILTALFASGFDATGPKDAALEQQGWPIDSIIEDRISLIKNSAYKSLLLIGAAFALLFYFLKEKVSKNIVLGALAVLIIGDIWYEDKKYLNNDTFENEKQQKSAYALSNADKQILQDKDPHYRVFNVTANPFTDAFTSYHHKSVGGYSAVKLNRYQDLIENQLSKNNTKVLNMLNTKYYIIQDQNSGQKIAERNPNALGNAWFVNSIKWVKNADEEMEGLSTFNPKDEVLIDERFKNYFDGSKNVEGSSNSTIQLTEYKPNSLTYSTNVSSANQFAVFSEIYYEGTDNDWKVFVDGNEVSHIRVNYLLRGLKLPQGQHKVEFKFLPKSYIVGEKISLVFSIFIYLVVIGAIYWSYKKKDFSLNTSKEESIDVPTEG